MGGREGGRDVRIRLLPPRAILASDLGGKCIDCSGVWVSECWEVMARWNSMIKLSLFADGPIERNRYGPLWHLGMINLSNAGLGFKLCLGEMCSNI